MRFRCELYGNELFSHDPLQAQTKVFLWARPKSLFDLSSDVNGLGIN
jgi:hypothetical protein